MNNEPQSIDRFTRAEFLDNAIKDLFFPDEKVASVIRVRFVNDCPFELEYRIKHNPAGMTNDGQIWIRRLGVGENDYALLWNPVPHKQFEAAWLYLCDRIYDNERAARQAARTELYQLAETWTPES